VTDAVNMISHRSLVDDHTHTPKVRLPVKLPQDSDEKWGLTILQCQEHSPQSPREHASVSFTLAI
jgi:hypothetical protein